METVSDGRKYLEPNRCEAPTFVSKKEPTDSLLKRVTRNPYVAALFVFMMMNTGCAEAFAHRPLPGETVVIPNTGGGNPKPGGFSVTIPTSTPETVAISSPAETLKEVKDLNQKIDTIYELRKEWIANTPWIDKNESVVPAPALGEVFDQVKKYNIQLQQIYRPDGNYSSDQINLINNIYLNLNNAPAKDQKFEETKIIIDPEAKNSQFIAEQVNDVLKLFPNHEKIISVIHIDSRDITWKNKWGDFIADAACYTYKDRGAEIFIPDRPNDAENWPDKKILLQRIVHEIAHAASLYGEGFTLQSLSPVEIINLILEDTLAADKEYREYYVSIYPDETNAYLVADLFGDTNTLSGVLLRYPDIKQAKLKFVNDWFSTLLRTNIDIVKIGEQSDVR